MVTYEGEDRRNPLNDRGLARVLDSIGHAIADLGKQVEKVEDKVDLVDSKVDQFAAKAVTHEELNAYDRMRKTTVRWAIGTIIATAMLLTAFATIIIQTRADVIIQP